MDERLLNELRELLEYIHERGHHDIYDRLDEILNCYL
jgi:hypothetical protein